VSAGAFLLATTIQWPEAVGLGTLAHVVLFCGIALHCLTHPRDSRSTILWLFTVWAFPFVGAMLYAAFGVLRVPRKAWHKHRSDRQFGEARTERERESQPLAYWRSLRAAHASQPECAETFNRVLDRITPDHPLLSGNAVELLLDGTETYPAMREAIRGAKHHIHLMAYIIGADTAARELLDACAERAAAGVKVRVMYDEFGSAEARLRKFFRRYRWVPNFRIVGFTQVNLLKRQIQVNLRNHRKIAVVDGSVAFTGGVNLHNGHLPIDGQLKVRDFHFRVRGPLVNELQYTFLRDWYYMTDEDPDELLSEAYFGRHLAAGPITARIVNSGPSSAPNSLDDVFFNALSEARRDVVATTPYLVLTEPLMEAMRMASMRGVTVRLIVPGNNNHISVKYASRSQYASLLTAGVRIFERHGPLLHAKAMVIDGALSIIGSANLDVRSLRLNYETVIVSYDATLAGRLLQEVQVDLAESEEVDLNIWSRRPWSQRVLENAFALISPIL
jgi:cardiolipin synthase